MMLDTTFLVDLLRKDRAAKERLQDLQDARALLKVPTTAIYELWEGAERSRNPHQEMADAQRILDGCMVLPLEARHAMRAGRLSGALALRGEVLDDVDLLIAGTAIEEDEAVLTRNVRDFRRVPDLRVETY